MAFKVVAVGANVPVPMVVHVPLPVEEEPFRDAEGLFTHTEIVAPAFTRGALLIVTIIASVVGLQLPTPVVVSTSVTDPAAVSAELGI